MDKESRKIYLTFDDGPVPGLTEDILDILDEKEVPALFFCVGDNVRKHPKVFEKISENGHGTGNHSYSHLNGWRTPNQLYFSNIERSEAFFKTPLFRPPYGRIKPSQLRVLRKKYMIILWSLLSGDFDHKTSPYKCYRNVADNLHNGAITLFHDNLKAKKNVLFALPRFIDHARAQGYSFSNLQNDLKHRTLSNKKK